MKLAVTKRARRIAKKFFRKAPHSTRRFSIEDYKALPKCHPGFCTE